MQATPPQSVHWTHVPCTASSMIAPVREDGTKIIQAVTLPSSMLRHTARR